MTEESTAVSKEEARQRLKELVLDHLGIPRPKQAAHIQSLQDELLPAFMELARHAWLASSPLPLRHVTLANQSSHPVYQYLSAATETQSKEVRKLTDILEELGVHALLDAVASSADFAMVGELPVDDYDTRLVREAGHRSPNSAVREFLRYAAQHPEVLADSETILVKTEKAILQAHRDINIIINPSAPAQPRAQPAAAPNAGAPAGQSARPAPTAGPDSQESAAPKPKRLKLFSGLGKLASGLVLLSGNAIVIPTVVIASVTALPVLGSLAAGIAAVSGGVSDLLREGE